MNYNSIYVEFAYAIKGNGISYGKKYFNDLTDAKLFKIKIESAMLEAKKKNYDHPNYKWGKDFLQQITAKKDVGFVVDVPVKGYAIKKIVDTF